MQDTLRHHPQTSYRQGADREAALFFCLVVVGDEDVWGTPFDSALAIRWQTIYEGRIKRKGKRWKAKLGHFTRKITTSDRSCL
jgi:hypothetical protein